jgi:uracil-DNA glycosylase
VIGQAPGTKVHASGVPWHDDSGERLRGWLGVDEETFYGPTFAIVPMGFCYPGRKGSGDAPPRPECAPLWHEPLLAAMPRLDLILLIGMYAQKRYLGRSRKRTLTDTVRASAEYAPRLLPLPHPSWRVRMWMGKNPWFEEEILPDLRARVQERI